MKLRTGIFLGLGAVALGLIATPFLLPLDTYRGSIEAAASRALGREVHIRGPMHLAVYPELGISLAQVSVANLAGAREPEMISVENVLVGAELMPLLSRKLEVTQIVLQKPVIRLEVNKASAVNWRFGEAAPAAESQTRTTAPAAAPNAATTSTAAGNVWVRNLRIDGGELTYYDARSDYSDAFHDISIRVAMPAAGTQARLQPANISGTITYNSEPLKIDGKIDNLDAVLKSQPTGTHVSIGSNIINADFTGSLGTEGQISGALKLGAHSVRSFAAWVRHPMPPGNGFGLVALEGQFSVRDGVYRLTHTHLAFDSMSLDATIAIDTNPDVFDITGGATIDRLDINPYLAPGASDDTVKAVKAKPADRSAPLAFGWLKAANADLKLAVGSLLAPNVKLDQAIINVALHNGVLKADLSNVTAYGGSGKGSLTIDASGTVPTFHETLDVSGLKAQTFLTDFMGVDRIIATGAVRLDLSSRGATEDAIIKALNGKGSIKFTDGTVKGVDLVAVGRAAQSVPTLPALATGGIAQVLQLAVIAGDTLAGAGAVGDNAKTAFSQLSSSFAVQNGVLRTNDLLLTSSEVEMTGNGAVDLSARTVDFHLKPKAKKGLLGKNEIGVPFYAKGPWDHPAYGPEVGELAKGIGSQLGNTAKLPVEVLKDPGNALKSFFGGLTGK